MDHRFPAVRVLAVAALGLTAASSAKAASLQSVSNWNGGTSFPSDVSMYIYVPDKVATKPPILTLVHYCGGTASAVFGQASGIVKAADQYGFIIVAPSSGRCWDVVSSKTRTRDGGGDSHAIKQMVVYAISKYQANADRVYSTGDSSGGMMTELLLAVYPDIFKGGSSFAGMPALCGTTTSSPGGYDGSCAGGNVTHTAQQWGDLVRAVYQGYTGHRPRLQLFHGDADTTISFKNMGESTKMYTNLLNLSATATTTDTGLTLGTHQATRQKWLSSCGYLVLDAWESINGDHGPSDALFVAADVVPFLGLDKTGLVDPEVAACSGDAGAGTGGTPGTGGASGAGGGSGTAAGGTGGTRDGGPQGGRDAGSGGTGAVAATGGTLGGGTSGSGGRTGGGGSGGEGGTQASGGRSGGGGAGGSGGTSETGGSQSGGSGGSGGVTASGGTTATGGSAASGSGGAGGGNAGSGGTTVHDNNNNGCSCALGATTKANSTLAVWLGLGLLALFLLRRRTQ